MKRLAPLLILFLLPACIINTGTMGSGVRLDEIREVREFSRIQVSGSTDVDVAVGGDTFVEVSGDDNLVPRLLTEVRGDTLYIEMERGSYNSRISLRARIVTPTLAELELKGSCDGVVRGLREPEFRAAVYGSGDIQAEGMVERLDLSVSGSGDLDMYELEAREAKVRIAGSGDVKLHAAESLEARISGSGDVRYRGEPRLAGISISGSGSIKGG